MKRNVWFAIALLILPALTSAVGVITVALPALSLTTGGVALAGLAALKKGLIAGAVLGSRGRRRREARVNFEEEVVHEIEAQDSNDCAKLLVCRLAAKPSLELSTAEKNILDAFPMNVENSELNEAAKLGSESSSELFCTERFTKCFQ